MKQHVYFQEDYNRKTNEVKIEWKLYNKKVVHDSK